MRAARSAGSRQATSAITPKPIAAPPIEIASAAALAGPTPTRTFMEVRGSRLNVLAGHRVVPQHLQHHRVLPARPPSRVAQQQEPVPQQPAPADVVQPSGRPEEDRSQTTMR